MEQKYQPTLILMGQQQRCGGSLLTRLFDSHPQLWVHPTENYSGRPYKYHFPNLNLPASPQQLWVDLQEYPLIAQGGRGKISKGRYQIYEFQYDPACHQQQFIQQLSTGEDSQRRILQAYFSSLFGAIANFQPPGTPRYYAYFTPRQCLYAEEFFADFPDGHVIQLVRHPLAYYNSVKSHNRYYDLEISKFVWRLFYLRAMDALVQGWRNYHIEIFEDLVADPNGVMGRLATRLQIPFVPTLLTPTFNGEPWGGDSNFGELKGVSPSVIDQYRHHLSLAEIDAFAAEIEQYQSLCGLLRQSRLPAMPDQSGLPGFHAYLQVYKQEKPYNTAGLLFTQPQVCRLLAPDLSDHHWQYYQLQAIAESITFYRTQEVPATIDLTLHPLPQLSWEFLPHLTDPAAMAETLIERWLLQGREGLQLAVAQLPPQLTLETLLAGMSFQIQRDRRGLSAVLIEDLQVTLPARFPEAKTDTAAWNLLQHLLPGAPTVADPAPGGGVRQILKNWIGYFGWGARVLEKSSSQVPKEH
ncbi:hypothetical protein DO97_10995 [Neosynechococcus sphagnicola sy1]|uniref:Sulfotransferase domain-containing protein n=1 Tax=Neosynechococcus sphagnicola sy1 TaxID=1497020 RepID=A0A098TN49_9CYAN|nr:sulfotransferase [Neosynechococcus sphagnicola]KGF72268.1 hypothetical protein DO97_10995 [Neosynechococcus sphagnicola sy1]